MDYNSDDIVVFEHVSLQLDSSKILTDVNLQIKQGEFLVILGSSGCGKTTTIKLINGLLYPTRGKVLVSGVPTVNWDPVKLRRQIGYVIQETGLFPHYTVEQNIGLVPRLEGWNTSRVAHRVQELLELVGLDSALSSRFPSELSGGQKQRVGVARALGADPPIILMDEPFAAVDPLNRLRIRRKFKEIQQSLGKTTVFVTHDVHEAYELATTIGLLDKGRLVELTSPEGFLRSKSTVAQSFVDCINPRIRSDLNESQE